MTGFVRGSANFATHGFIPVIFSPKVLAILDKITPTLSCVSSDYESEIEKQGDIVRVRQLGNININSYTSYSALTYQNVTENYQDLVIDQANYWAFIVDYMDITQSDLDVMGGYEDRAAIANRNNVDSNVFSLMAAGVSATNTIGGVAVGQTININSQTVFNIVTYMLTLLEEANAFSVVNERPFLIVPSRFKNAILQYLGAKWTPLGDEKNMEGEILKFGEFDIYLSTNIPYTAATGGNDDYFPVVGGLRYATSFAMQVNIVEEIPVFQTQFGEAKRGLELHGTKVFHPTALVKAICKV